MFQNKKGHSFFFSLLLFKQITTFYIHLYKTEPNNMIYIDMATVPIFRQWGIHC